METIETYHVDLAAACDRLSYPDMIGLSQLFESWALTEDLTDDMRTKVMLWSVDYERIAQYVGPDWIAPNRDSASLVDFVAQVLRG